ncbi:hypothetical protein GQ53DRAFT_155410 [Thozetella sp. PMI_491]|nr:hypothetical protein GQ53DRAFT_155410 [Thozetella sp. PMI_491]
MPLYGAFICLDTSRLFLAPFCLHRPPPPFRLFNLLPPAVRRAPCVSQRGSMHEPCSQCCCCLSPSPPLFSPFPSLPPPDATLRVLCLTRHVLVVFGQLGRRKLFRFAASQRPSYRYTPTRATKSGRPRWRRGEEGRQVSSRPNRVAAISHQSREEKPFYDRGGSVVQTDRARTTYQKSL